MSAALLRSAAPRCRESLSALRKGLGGHGGMIPAGYISASAGERPGSPPRRPSRERAVGNVPVPSAGAPSPMVSTGRGERMLQVSETENRKPTTAARLFMDDDSQATHGNLGFREPDLQSRALSYDLTKKPPPFDPEERVVKLLNDLLDGTVSIADMKLHAGAVTQLYYLVFVVKPPGLKATSWTHFHALLVALSGRLPVATPSKAVITKLRMILTRKQAPPGLYTQLGLDLRRRGEDPQLREGSVDDARKLLFMRLDARTVELPLEADAAPDPAPPPPPPPPVVAPSPPPVFACLSVTTRYFQYACNDVANVSFRRSDALSLSTTVWLEVYGEFPLEVLCIIDAFVRSGEAEERNPTRANKREGSYHQQLVVVRQELDAEREECARLRVQLGDERSARELDPARAACRLGRELARAEAEARRHEAALIRLQADHKAELREARAVHAADRRRLEGEARAERVDADERATHLEAQITELERQLRRAGVSAKQQADELYKKVNRLEQGRVWTAVRQAEDRTRRAEEQRAAALHERDTALAGLRERNSSTAGMKQELAYLRHQTKTLSGKIAEYQDSGNRRFFDAEPQMERIAALEAAVARLETENSRLQSIVAPSAKLFYSSRGDKGGRRCSDEWDMLTMGLSVYNIPSDNVKAVVIAIGRFFNLQLPTEERVIVTKGESIITTRIAIPGKTHTKEMLEVGGEVSDLVTYTEIAEGTSIGLTFDGCTINMYTVFGGGVCIVKKDGQVVRRMAFAEMMTRETVVNKMRTLQDYFARGRACLELLQHPLAGECRIDRARATCSDRGGADGKVANALSGVVTQIVERRLGWDAWTALGNSSTSRDSQLPASATTDPSAGPAVEEGQYSYEQLVAMLDVYAEGADISDAWSAAQARWDDDQLDERAVDAEYKPVFFDALSETTQEYVVAVQLLGMRAYQACPESQVVFVALYCLEHALSNVLVAADEGMDEVAREIIPSFISDGTKKEKAFVEINSSPGNKMILSFCKLFAPCSDKDWAKSFDFQGWELNKYGTNSVRDLQAILGSRFGIFFKNARPILRAWARAAEYLAMMEKIQTSDGKLRAATRSALDNKALKANMIAKDLIARLVYWPWMVRMNSVKHAFDMALPMQSAAAAFAKYAADPTEVLSGRGQIFSDEPLAAPDVELQANLQEMRDDAELYGFVRRFVQAALVKARPQLLKHTAEYQPGGIAAEGGDDARLVAAALKASSHEQEGDFGHLQYLCGSKGKARHQKVRSAVGHAKLKRNGTLDALKEMAPAVRRRYLALGRLMRAQRLQREGRNRAEVARNIAAGLQAHRDELVAKADTQEAERAAKLEKYAATTRVTTMQAAHHLTVEQLKDQLWIRKVVDKRRIDGKELTVGGNRTELLGRLKSVMLLEDEHAADGYDVDAPKGFYTNGAVGGKRPAQVDAAEHEAEEPQQPSCDGSPVERIETAEERSGEMHYLIKWRGRDETLNSWVAQSALPDAHAIELAAAFEESQVEDTGEEELDDGEFYVEALLERRISRKTGLFEYLVRWAGYGEEEDGWEPVDGLPQDMVEAFDAEKKASRAAKRARRS